MRHKTCRLQGEKVWQKKCRTQKCGDGNVHKKSRAGNARKVGME